MRARDVLLLVGIAVLASACGTGDAALPDETRRVEIFGPFQDREAELLTSSLEPFEQRTGIDIRYTGTGRFAADLADQVRSADPPDIAFVPQPGLVDRLVRDGVVTPLGTQALAALDANYDPQIRALGESAGRLVAVPFRLSLKSLVWYRPATFAELELTVPETFDELVELTDRIEQLGLTPWCFGIEAQGATGWVATDWVEEVVLRRSGPEVYDDWTTTDVRFADAAIAGAFDEVADLLLAPGRAAGGVAGIVQTPVRESPLGLLDDPPDCVLHRQADFATGWLPSDIELGPDGDLDVFVLPGTEPGPAPLLVGATVAVGFDDRADVESVLAHLADPASTRDWEQAGGYLSPRTAGRAGAVAPPFEERLAELLDEAEVVRVDASDQFPAEVGTGLLWEQISAWVAGALSYEELARTVDEALAEP